MSRALGIWFAALLSLAVGCASLTDDSSFDLWCGDALCKWTTDEGSIARAPTWHVRDYGVSLEGMPAQISQVPPSRQADCILFTLITDVDAHAQLELMLDFNDDGVVDYETAIPAARWQTNQIVVRPPLEYERVRYILRKNGAGRAVLAQVLAEADVGPCTGERVTLEEGSMSWMTNR